MKIFSPGSMIRLWILYMENGVAITGLTDLKVVGKNDAGGIVLAEQTLTEVGGGEYSYSWNTAGITPETVVRIFFKKGSTILIDEEYLIENIEDDDGRAF